MTSSMKHMAFGFLFGACMLAGIPASAEAAEPSFRHTHMMRGQVLEVDDGTAVVCIGRADGAEVGQELAVVRHRAIGSAPKAGPRFKREDVGSVRIIEVFDEHYASAAVVSGDVRKHDTVELQTTVDAK